jgi:predicted nucleic acid-binding protein
MKFALEEVPASKPWLTKTLELVQLHDVTFYDAAYHALAIVNGGTFVTADSRYATKTASSGSVVLVGDWRPPPEPVTSPVKRRKQ